MIRAKFRLSNTLVILAAALPIHSAWAISLSNEEFKEYASEEAYWVVSVDCEDGSDSRVIQQKTDTTQWCSRDLDGYCDDSKEAASEKVCGADFYIELRQIQQTEQAQKRAEQTKLEEERERQQSQEKLRESQERERQRQLSIDAELLDIEQQKLSLRRQELELQKRAVEIRDQLKALEESQQPDQ